jgi:demethylmenaquinone methyltransferase / 2-methoxy-6-polyprenyl-1,4-benzoquinol methylase
MCHAGPVTRADLGKRPAEVSAMFDAVAERYDLLNDVLSVGQCRRWRSAVARSVAAGPGEVVLDVAAGTGTSSRSFTRSGARCVACDFSLGMLHVGAARQAGTVGVRFAAGDAMALPFTDAAFDAVTISFGLRNVADPGAALAEMLRVTRPGGRLVVCEFSHLRYGDRLYQRYLASALPAAAARLSRNPGAYSYLAESIADWPAQPELAEQITAAGWSAVTWRNLTLGVVAVHVARRPA